VVWRTKQKDNYYYTTMGQEFMALEHGLLDVVVIIIIIITAAVYS